MANIFDKIEAERNIFDKIESERKPQSFLEKLLGGPIETSPLSGTDRVKTSWGNKDGVVEYLKSQGRNAEYKGGDLYVDGQKADPGGEYDLAALTGPGMMAAAPYHIFQALKGMSGGKAPDNFRNAASGVADMGNDFNEGAPSFLENILTGAASSVPWAGVPLSAAAGYATEKLKEGVGGLLGTYKSKNQPVPGESGFDELLRGASPTPESNQAGANAGVSALIPKAIGAAGDVVEYLSQKGLDKKIPQEMYAKATGIMKKFLKNPEIVDEAFERDLTGTTKQINRKASEQLKDVNSQYAPKLKGKTGNVEPLLDDDLIEKFVSKFDKLDQDKARKMITESLETYRGAYAGGVDLNDLNLEKSNLADSVYNLSKGEVKDQMSAKNKKVFADLFREFIAENEPSVVPLNKSHYALSSVKNATGEQIVKDAGKSPFKLGLADVALGSGGLATGNPGVLGLIAAHKAMGTTYAKTKTASFLNKILQSGANNTWSEGTKDPGFAAALDALLNSKLGNTR